MTEALYQFEIRAIDDHGQTHIRVTDQVDGPWTLEAINKEIARVRRLGGIVRVTLDLNTISVGYHAPRRFRVPA